MIYKTTTLTLHFLLITLFTGLTCYGMKRPGGSKVHVVSLNEMDGDIVQECGEWLSVRDTRALACTSTALNNTISNSPYWTKKFIYGGINITTSGAKVYYDINGKIMKVCSASDHQHFDKETYTTLFKDPFADSNYFCGESQKSLLMMASSNLCLPLIDNLVREKKADANRYYGNEDLSPIFCAISATLPNNTKRETALHKIKAIQCLEHHGANIHHTTPLGTNYLHHSVHLDPLLVPFLIERGVEVNALSTDYKTPLAWLTAIYHNLEKEGGFEAMEALLAHNANPYVNAGGTWNVFTIFRRYRSLGQKLAFCDLFDHYTAGRNQAWYEGFQ
jgi:hypothetical protein